MGIYGQDWASYQSSAPDTSGLGFVFVKVTEGLSYVNPEWVAQRDHAKAAGLVWGAYHYPHMDNAVEAEADYFLAQVAWKPGDMACLDWEGYDSANQGVPASRQLAYKEAWLRYVKSKLPRNPVGMYCNTDYWRTIDTTGYYGDFLWIATAGRGAGDPGIQASWLFHQYSEEGGLDRDYCRLDSTQALRDWTLSFQPGPTPPPTEDDMPQWHSGTVTPGAQPTVALVPHGTAWSAAGNRRLHLGMDRIGDPGARATVRVAIHDGRTWSSERTVEVSAAGGTVDVDLSPDVVKVSLQTTAEGVAYAIESW
ncbi:putative hydrolase (plasmid) [Streptantibioticus cattleyicolor NRRL 8057 = DSM 46488]|uniref:Putative hydrolase n=2 Tax=Streptantibioticus cattleyicolor TaxID=29303 RepID=F8JJ32_STREN|nr:putative hydrolase [Streptantibioticus cattleyicolor NRRL 8057 = DSM 46488]CCB72078.1 Putative hydrolase (modular protein) [Streptantibioticus cattleyicolor NRRL 8057 = DSM 46488]